MRHLEVGLGDAFALDPEDVEVDGARAPALGVGAHAAEGSLDREEPLEDPRAGSAVTISTAPLR